MARESLEDRGQGNGESPKELRKPEIVVKSVLSHEFRRGIAFNKQSEADRALGKLQDGPPFDKIIVDQTQQPPLYILTSHTRADDLRIAQSVGKEEGYDCSVLFVRLQLDPSTNNLSIDFDQIVSTLRDASVSTNVSGKELIDHFARIVKHRASIYEIEDEDERHEAHEAYEKGNRTAILLAKQDELDVYLELGEEAENRLLSFKPGDNLDTSGTTLVLPLLSNNHPQASNELKRVNFGLIWPPAILPAINIMLVPSSKEGKIDDAPPNFDPQILFAGRDLTERITAAFETPKPKA